ncbi:MAG: LLM class F420-dependent oxidoreductase, partial [Actinomycetota bacterium]|nr:LLM class F420-dependent oxidoreductase [Actinomycetota bacterium]
IGAYFTAVTDATEPTLEAMAGAFGMPSDELARHPHALIGSVGEICEVLQRRREEYGISYVTVGAANMEAFAPVVAQLAGT